MDERPFLAISFTVRFNAIIYFPKIITIHEKCPKIAKFAFAL
jgi:hypothetical protein